CASLNDHSKVKLILVVEGNRPLAYSPLARYLHHLSCGLWYRLNPNGTLSNPEPWQEIRWLHSNWLLLFDWSHLNQRTLTGSVLAANQLYTRCERCLPPIGLLDSTRWSVHRLFHWSRQILPRLDPQF